MYRERRARTQAHTHTHSPRKEKKIINSVTQKTRDARTLSAKSCLSVSAASTLLHRFSSLTLEKKEGEKRNAFLFWEYYRHRRQQLPTKSVESSSSHRCFGEAPIPLRRALRKRALLPADAKSSIPFRVSSASKPKCSQISREHCSRGVSGMRSQYLSQRVAERSGSKDAFLDSIRTGKT